MSEKAENLTPSHEFMYFPVRNRQKFKVKRVLDIDIRRSIVDDKVEILISYTDGEGADQQNRQILVTDAERPLR